MRFNVYSGELRTFRKANTVENEDKNVMGYLMAMLKTFSNGLAIPYHILSFKKGSIVMFHRNLNSWNGLVSVTR